MQIEEAIYSYLSTYPGLTSLISTRIYPDVIPQRSVLPAVAIQLISKVRNHLFQGDSTMAQSRYQFSCYGMDRSGVKAVAKQIRAALQNYSGIMGGSGGVAVSAVLVDGETDGYETETKTYSVLLDFLIWHEE